MGRTLQQAEQVSADSVVAVRSAAKIQGSGNTYFIFASRQIAEVTADLLIRPVPFAPPFLCGICSWRNRFLPVVDLEQRFGMKAESGNGDVRFLVVRSTVASDEGDRLLHHCVVQVSERISTMKLIDSDSIYSNRQLELENLPNRGVFCYGDDVLIAPNLLEILDIENCFDKGE